MAEIPSQRASSCVRSALFGAVSFVEVLVWSWEEKGIPFFSFMTLGFLNPPNYLLSFTLTSLRCNTSSFLHASPTGKFFFQVSHFLSYIGNLSSFISYQIPNYIKYFVIYCCSFIFLAGMYLCPLLLFVIGYFKNNPLSHSIDIQ